MKMDKMQRMLCFVTGILVTVSVPAQTLFTYGKHTATKAEFMHSFQKSPVQDDRSKALKDYLPLYIQYRQKVQYAYDKKMDTLLQMQQELFNYQLQLQESFIQQQSNIENLVNEAAVRSRKDILLGHIFFPFLANDEASKTEARNKAEKAYALMKKGSAFEAVANQFNANGQPANGVAGWITCFVLPYRFETAVYNAPKGGLSDIQTGSDGFHIFKNIDERPAKGKINVAQILLWLPADAEASAIKAKQQLADSLYRLLSRGADFDKLALQFSNDRSSYASGGVLPTIEVGQYDPVFESAAFSLHPNHRLSAPFRTSFGIHLLKYVNTPSPKEDEDEKTIIRQQIGNSDRAQLAREDFLKSLQKKLGYVEGNFKKDALWQYSDSALRNGQLPINGILPTTFLFSVGKEKVLVENWILYLRGISRNQTFSFEKTWQEYVLQTIENYYRENLAEIVPEFKKQLEEFKDANMLFQAMDTRVWNAANTDTAGQRRFYEANKHQYTWEDGALVISVVGTDSANAALFRTMLMKEPNQWRLLAARFRNAIVADSARVEKALLSAELFDNGIKEGTASKLLKNPGDNSFSFSYIIQLLPGGDTRDLEDARGWVIGDYQAKLEQQWVVELKKNYPVKINEAVWQQVLKTR